MRASHNAQEDVAGKRKQDRVTTEDKRDRKRDSESERGKRKRKKERVDVPTPLSDRPTRTKPFPPR